MRRQFSSHWHRQSINALPFHTKRLKPTRVRRIRTGSTRSRHKVFALIAPNVTVHICRTNPVRLSFVDMSAIDPCLGDFNLTDTFSTLNNIPNAIAVLRILADISRQSRIDLNRGWHSRALAEVSLIVSFIGIDGLQEILSGAMEPFGRYRVR